MTRITYALCLSLLASAQAFSGMQPMRTVCLNVFNREIGNHRSKDTDTSFLVPPYDCRPLLPSFLSCLKLKATKS
jgi:hypothetical protein